MAGPKDGASPPGSPDERWKVLCDRWNFSTWNVLASIEKKTKARCAFYGDRCLLWCDLHNLPNFSAKEM